MFDTDDGQFFIFYLVSWKIIYVDIDFPWMYTIEKQLCKTRADSLV